jgi:hypothetical protein
LPHHSNENDAPVVQKIKTILSCALGGDKLPVAGELTLDDAY